MSITRFRITQTPSNTPSNTPVVSPSGTACPTPSPTATPTNTPTASITPTITPTQTITPTSTITPTPTLTPCICFPAGTGFNQIQGSILAIQKDTTTNRLYCGGNFNSYNGNTGIITFTALDLSSSNPIAAFTGTTTNGPIQDIKVQTDGKILIGGTTNSWKGVLAPNNFYRVNPDGTLDAAFAANLGTGFTGAVSNIWIDANGKILVGGVMTQFNGTTIGMICRLNANGTLDTTFSGATPGFTGAGGAFNGVQEIISDGGTGYYVSGNFNTFNGVACNDVVRLNADGSLNATFNASSVSGGFRIISIDRQPSTGYVIVGNANDTRALDTTGAVVWTYNTSMIEDNFVVVQSDNKIIVAGRTSGTGENIIRLNANGTLDTTLTSPTFTQTNQPNQGIMDVVVDDNNSCYIVGGNWISVNGFIGTGVMRIYQDGAIDFCNPIPVSPTPSNSPTRTPTTTPTITPTNTQTQTPSNTASPTITPTNTATPTFTPTPTQTPCPIGEYVIAYQPYNAGSGGNPVGYSFDYGVSVSGSNPNAITNFFLGADPSGLVDCATDGSTFIAVGSNGRTTGNAIVGLYSTDGVSWSSSNLSSIRTGRLYMEACLWDGTQFHAVGTGDPALVKSTDGITWTGFSNSATSLSILSEFPAIREGFMYYDGTSYWVGNRTLYKSADGTSYSNVGIGTIDRYMDMFYTGSRWFVVGYTRGSFFGPPDVGRMFYSDNGTSWTQITLTSFGFTQLWTIAWNGSLFLAGGEGSNRMIYSNDGLSWSANTNGNTTFPTEVNNILWDGSRWFATGLNGGTARSAYSTDGFTWTLSNVAIVNNFPQGLTSIYQPYHYPALNPCVPTPTPSNTPTNTQTPSVSPTNTNTPTITPSITPTNTQTATPTMTETPSSTPPDVSPTSTPTNTATQTQTTTPSVSPTNTITPTTTATPTATQTCCQIDILTNNSLDVDINTFDVDGTAATVIGGSLPNTPGNGTTLCSTITGTVDITVSTFNSVAGQKITLCDSNGTCSCYNITGTGPATWTWTDVVLNCSTPMTLIAEDGSC